MCVGISLYDSIFPPKTLPSSHMFPTTSQILVQAKTSALLVSNPVNVRYLSGVDVSFGSVLIQGKSMTLFTDSRYVEMCKKEARKGVKVRLHTSLKDVLKNIRTCGFEADSVTISRYKSLKKNFKNTKFAQTSGVIEHFRRQKAPEEIKAFRKAQLITKRLMQKIPSVLKNGTTEKKVAWMLEGWAREMGADGLSFEPIVAFGAHSSRPHHHPTDRKLKKGDVVQIDVGAKYKGYCADQSAVFFTGSPTKKQQQAYDALLEAKQAAICVLREGVTNQEVGKAATKVLKKYKLDKYFTHALGHGVGLEIHEGVTLSEHAPKMKLLKNEIVTVEPGVYFEGKFGMRLEEEIIVP